MCSGADHWTEESVPGVERTEPQDTGWGETTPGQTKKIHISIVGVGKLYFTLVDENKVKSNKSSALSSVKEII